MGRFPYPPDKPLKPAWMLGRGRRFRAGFSVPCPRVLGPPAGGSGWVLSTFAALCTQQPLLPGLRPDLVQRLSDHGLARVGDAPFAPGFIRAWTEPPPVSRTSPSPFPATGPDRRRPPPGRARTPPPLPRPARRCRAARHVPALRGGSPGARLAAGT